MLMQGFSTDLDLLKKEITDAFDAWDANSHNYEVDETKLYSINLELMKYIRARDDKPLVENKGNRQQNLNASDVNRNRFNQEINKENLDAQERFKNFNNFLDYTMKSPSKLKKKQGGNEAMMIGKVPNQKEIMEPSNFARNNLPSSSSFFFLKKKLFFTFFIQIFKIF